MRAPGASVATVHGRACETVVPSASVHTIHRMGTWVIPWTPATIPPRWHFIHFVLLFFVQLVFYFADGFQSRNFSLLFDNFEFEIKLLSFGHLLHCVNL